MGGTWIPALALTAGTATGTALAAYAGWIIRCRKPEMTERFSPATVMAASLVNGLGWLVACSVFQQGVEAAEFGLMVSSAVVLTLIDMKIRVIPNELTAALLMLSIVMALLEKGPQALIGRFVGLLVALTLFLVAMWIAGPGKVGMGDVKLAAAVGFAAGFPDVLIAILVMALASGLFGAVKMRLGRMGRKTPMPFAGFIMAGLVASMLLDKVGALSFMK